MPDFDHDRPDDGHSVGPELTDLAEWLVLAGDVRLPATPDVRSIVERARQRVVRRRARRGAVVLAVLLPALAVGSTLLTSARPMDGLAAGSVDVEILAVAATDVVPPGRVIGPVDPSRLVDIEAEPDRADCRTDEDRLHVATTATTTATSTTATTATTTTATTTTATAATRPSPAIPGQNHEDRSGCGELGRCGGPGGVLPKVDLVDCRPENEIARQARSLTGGGRTRM